MRHAIAILLAGFALTGCNYHEVDNFDRLVKFEPPPIYCYQSLAYATCYAHPLAANQQDRLVGYYGPPPSLYYAASAPPAPADMAPGNRPPLPPMQQPRTPVDAQPLAKPGMPATPAP